MEISKTKAQLLASLSSKKMRQKYGLFLAEGAKCALDTIGAFDPAYLIATHQWLDNNKLPEHFPANLIYTAGEEVMRKISSLSTPPDVIAVFKLPDENREKLTLKKDALHLMLDGIQDPGNLGTIIRTADWFGFNRVICSRDTVDVYNPKTVQATMGSLRRVKVIYADLPQLLRENNVTHIYGTVLNGKNIFKQTLSDSGVIIMGNEGKGLSDAVKELLTDPLLIPPYREDEHGESLNVAIATAITLAQFRK